MLITLANYGLTLSPQFSRAAGTKEDTTQCTGKISFIWPTQFYDNRTNSCVLICQFLLLTSGQTNEFIIYAMRQQARADNLTVCYYKKANGHHFFMRLSCYRQ